MIRALCRTLLLGTLLSLSWPSIAEPDDNGGALERAQALIRQRQGVEARNLLLPLAEAGDKEAQSLLAITYINLLGDLESGRHWLRPTADAGDPQAQLQMAISYLGRGSETDDRTGLDWLRRAAQGGSADAAKQMALGYTMGWWGLARSPEDAAAWREQAAALGSPQTTENAPLAPAP